MVNPRRFDPVSLRIYAAVFESCSLTAGAAAFGISLAAATKRISDLEHDAGTRLFERSKSGVRPTAAGETLYGHPLTAKKRGASLLRLLGTAADTLGRPLKVWVQVRSFRDVPHDRSWHRHRRAAIGRGRRAPGVDAACARRSRRFVGAAALAAGLPQL